MRSIVGINKHIGFLAFFLVAFNGLSQGGFLGRKNAIDMCVIGNIPFSSGAFLQPNYFQVGSKLKERKDWLDLGLNLHYRRTIGVRTELGVDFIFKGIQVDRDTLHQSIFKNNELIKYERNTNIHAESADIHNYSIMPTISISPYGSHANVGISHEIGLGITFSKIQEKNYYYSLNELNNQVYHWTDPDVYTLSTNWPSFRGYCIKYGAQIQLPIGYHFQFKIGTSAVVTLYPKPDFSVVENIQEGFFNYSALFFNVQRENLLTLNLKTGLVYVF